MGISTRLLLLSLLSLALAQTSSAQNASDCFQQRGLWWTYYVDEVCQEKANCIDVGTNVRYDYTDEHNVYSLWSSSDFDSCNLASASELCDTTMGNGGCVETFTIPGTYYRVCTIPGHCELGMKLRFDVKFDCSPPAPPPPPPPTPTPAEEKLKCCVYNGSTDIKCLCNTNSKCPSIDGMPLIGDFDSTCEHCQQFCRSEKQ